MKNMKIQLCVFLLLVAMVLPAFTSGATDESALYETVTLDNSENMVALRTAFESMGIAVNWIQEKSAIRLSYGNATVYIVLNWTEKNHFIAMRDELILPPYGTGTQICEITRGYFRLKDGATYLPTEDACKILSAMGFNSQLSEDRQYINVRARGSEPKINDLITCKAVDGIVLRSEFGEISISLEGLVNVVGGSIAPVKSNEFTFECSGKTYSGRFESKQEKPASHVLILIRKPNTDAYSKSNDDYIALNPWSADGTGHWYNDSFYLSESSSRCFLQYFGYEIADINVYSGDVYVTGQLGTVNVYPLQE